LPARLGRDALRVRGGRRDGHTRGRGGNQQQEE
jgi:hypothetical protein